MGSIKVALGIIVIVATIVIALRQPANKMGRIICIFLCGVLAFIAVAKLPDIEKNDDKKGSNVYSSYYEDKDHKPSGNSGPAVNRTPAMTKEEAERLKGTGYHGTKPNSSAEALELKAAQIKCKKCGYHSDNGANSMCDYCQWQEYH